MPGLTLLLFLGPIAAGLIGTLLPAFGYLPSLGGEQFTLEPWRALFSAPGLGKAVAVSLLTGIGSTVIAFLMTVLIFASSHGTTAFDRAKRAMTPLLAVPHLAMAVGLAFLLSPSGWLTRLVSPWPSGWETPPDIGIVQGPYGIALTLGLVIKELPFLLLMTFAALGQIRADDQIKMARSLGYGPVQAWLKVILPLIYPQIRLPLYAVLAFSLSVVDMAMVLGPTTPPTLAPLVLRWFNDPELTMRFQAAAGAILQLLIVISAIACWRLAEHAVGRLFRPWLIGGRRGGNGRIIRHIGWSGLGLVFLLAGGSLLSLLVWSIAGRWRFPSSLPETLSLKTWMAQAESLIDPAWTTFVVGIIATLIALVLVIGCLEHESRLHRRPGIGALTLIYIPLLIPQIGFLFGVQVAFVRVRLDGGWIGLIWSHLLFVLPYVFLALADSYRALDPRYARIALMLGKPPIAVLFKVKLTMLLRSVLIAAAVGFAVSVAQFLPTQFIGAGRLSTLTTEALSLAAGGNRRVVGLFAILLASLPLIGFALATLIPAWRFRKPSGHGDRRAVMKGLMLNQISIRVDGKTLFEDFDLSVKPGDVTTIMGPSGCGKSSLLSLICGTLEPTFEASGVISLDGREIDDLPPERRRVGILFQDDLLFPHLSVGENLSFALPSDIRPRQTRMKAIDDALVEAGLQGFADRDPASLSGGQRARVALMRTLLAAPRCLLLDEPFGKLDQDLRERVRRFVFDHAREAGLADPPRHPRDDRC